MKELSFLVSGLTRQCATVPIVDDNKVEYDETLTVELLSTDGGYPTLFPSTAVIPIVDDDSKCSCERVVMQVNAVTLEFELSTNNVLVTYSQAIRAISKLISLEKI